MRLVVLIKNVTQFTVHRDDVLAVMVSSRIIIKSRAVRDKFWNEKVFSIFLNDSERKLVKVSNNFNQANEFNDFCSDSLSCITSIAFCDGSNSSRKFCQCPTGYTVSENREECSKKMTCWLSYLNFLCRCYWKFVAITAIDYAVKLWWLWKMCWC